MQENESDIEKKTSYAKVTKGAIVFISVGCLIHLVCMIASRHHDVVSAFALMLSSPHIIVAEFLLMFVNIFVETVRWHFISRGISDSSYIRSVRSTLRAVMFGNATPGNVGEHMGRVMGQADKHLYLCASLFASFQQTAVITAGGILSSLALWFLGLESNHTLLFICLSIAFISFSAFVLVLKFSSKIRRQISNYLDHTCRQDLILSFAVCALRFIVFSFQFAMAIAMSATPAAVLMFVVMQYYFLITFTPRINIIDIGVKGSLAVVVISHCAAQADIIAASIVVWVVNIVIPSAAGWMTEAYARFRRGVQ